MKPLPTLILSLIVSVGMGGCEPDGNDEVRLNEFMKSAKRPIIVRYKKNIYNGGRNDLTLIDRTGKILLLQYSPATLPDTIK